MLSVVTCKELVYFTEIHEQTTVTGNYHSKESTQNILLEYFVRSRWPEQVETLFGWVHATIVIIIGQP